MSSYVIGKANYIRCAGAIAGIKQEVRDIWVFNYKDYRNFNDDDYYKLFSWIYECNAKSVQMQYNDDTCESDDNDYMSEFEKYKKLAKQAIWDNQVDYLIKSIAQFFSSIKYQIEDDELHKKVSCYLNIVLVAICDKTILHKEGVDCWGDFVLDKSDTEIVDIMDMI